MRNYPLMLVFCLVVTLISCNRNQLVSLTTVSPGKRFELGGNQKGAFEAQLSNVGDVPVTIIERLANGTSVNRGVFKSGDSQTVQFAAGSAVLVDNASAQAAQLRLVITGDKDLSMRERSR